MKQLRFDNILGACETVLDNNPLGGICGQVCPVSQLCQGACTRKHIDKPIQIGAVQKFLHDYGIENKIKNPPVPSVKSGHKVAIVGAGPAGLACARYIHTPFLSSYLIAFFYFLVFPIFKINMFLFINILCPF